MQTVDLVAPSPDSLLSRGAGLSKWNRVCHIELKVSPILCVFFVSFSVVSSNDRCYIFMWPSWGILVITATNRNGQNLNGHKPERPQTVTATNRNGHKPKRPQTGMATNRNGHKPERPQTERSQTETATNRNGHKYK